MGAATSNTHVISVRENTQCPGAKIKRTNQSKGPPSVRVQNTPVRAEVLARHLVGYDKDKASYLIEGFSYGFHVESEGLLGSRTEVNNPGMSKHLHTVLRKKLQNKLMQVG